MNNGGTLPYVVDTAFFAAGYETDYFAIHALPTGCPNRAPAPNMGMCYGFKYDSIPAGPVGDAGLVAQGGAGVAWQANLQKMTAPNGSTYDNNFGVAPGVIIPPGATKVSFYAKGAAGGETLTFGFGGINNALCDDANSGMIMQALTTTWTNYTIPITGTYAAGMVTGFFWYTNAMTDDAGAPQPITFYIDDITWQM